MSWQPCSRTCRGQCPCPEPSWMWRCNQKRSKAVDPQQRWKPTPLWGTKHTRTMKSKLKSIRPWKSQFVYSGEYE